MNFYTSYHPYHYSRELDKVFEQWTISMLSSPNYFE